MRIHVLSGGYEKVFTAKSAKDCAKDAKEFCAASLSGDQRFTIAVNNMVDEWAMRNDRRTGLVLFCGPPAA